MENFRIPMVASSEPSRLPVQFAIGGKDPENLPIISPSPPDLTMLNVDANLGPLMNASDAVYNQIDKLAFEGDPGRGFQSVAQLCHLVQRLLTLEYGVEMKQASIYLLNEACRQATALYLMLSPERYYPSTQLTVNALLHQLKRSLVYALADGEMQEDHPLLLWTFCIGAVAAQRLPEYRWFVDNLAFLLSRTGITTDGELKARIGHIMSFESFGEFATREVWSQVEIRLSKD